MGQESVTFQFKFEEAQATFDSQGKAMRSYFGEPLLAYINLVPALKPLVFSQDFTQDKVMNDYQQKPSLMRKPKSE